MSTRDRIIETAQRLFSENGVTNVRSRDISAALAISNGNLTYHFPTIESLVEAIFDQMLQESSSQVGSLDSGGRDLITYMRLIEWFASFQARAVDECSALSPEGMPAQVLSLLEPYLTAIGAEQRDAFIQSRDSLTGIEGYKS